MTLSNNNSTTPKIWKEFVVDKQNFWIQNAEEQQFDLIADAMAYGFMKDEPLSMYFKGIDTSFKEKIKQSYIEILKTGFCIVCMTKKDDKAVLVGVQCFDFGCTTQANKSFRMGVNLFQYMLGLANVCAELGIERYLVDRGLYVVTEYRQKGIASCLLKCWPLICKHTGQEIAMGIFSSKYSQAAARNAGLTEIYFRLYEDMRKDLPSDIPLGVEGHTTGMSLFIVRP